MWVHFPKKWPLLNNITNPRPWLPSSFPHCNRAEVPAKRCSEKKVYKVFQCKQCQVICDTVRELQEHIVNTHLDPEEVKNNEQSDFDVFVSNGENKRATGTV